MIKRYEIGTRRKRSAGSDDAPESTRSSRTFPAAELSRE
jgi:hypothetical protein